MVSRSDKVKIVLIVVSVLLLLACCIVAVLIIDSRLSVNPGTGSDNDVTFLFFFVLGCIFFPRAWHSYIVERRKKPTVVWYQRLNLVLCLIGLVSGLLFGSSVLQKWTLFVSMNNIAQYQSSMLVGDSWLLVIVNFIAIIVWVILLIVLVHQGVKRRKQRDVVATSDNKSEE